MLCSVARFGRVDELPALPGHGGEVVEPVGPVAGDSGSGRGEEKPPPAAAGELEEIHGKRRRIEIRAGD